MGIILKIIAVLILSACLSGMLFYSGLLQLESQDVTKQPEGSKTVDRNVQHAADEPEKKEELDRDTSENAEDKKAQDWNAEEKPSNRLKDDIGAIIPAENFSFIFNTDIYHRSQSYLEFLAGDSSGNIERRFSTFLEGEFDLSKTEIDRMLQMAFWKNFLVLQYWSPDDANNLKLAFERELALKKSGFKARGLQLMTTEINEAKGFLSGILENYRQEKGKKEQSPEDKQ